MAVSRDDQNTFLMIGGVLIICLIALIAVLSSIWTLIRDPVNAVINTVSTFIRVQTLDYNFAIPVALANNPSPIPQPTTTPNPVNLPTINLTFGSTADKDIDYNFPIDNFVTNHFDDALLTDSELSEMNINGEAVQQKNLSIQIPSLNINSPIIQGLDSESILKQGFWAVPSERKLGRAEVIVTCNRRYFGPTDPKSCWFLDKIAIGNAITVTYNDVVLTYRVVGINRFLAEDPLVFKASDTEDLIRIVTTDPLASNTNRLVVLGQRVQ